MLKEIDILNKALAEMGKPELSVGIGLYTGEAVAGHVGSGRPLEFPLIGVPVHTSSYLAPLGPAQALLSATPRNLRAPRLQ